MGRRSREHIVLEQAARAGNVWRSDRWDSFTLLTPNWSFRLPGAEYHGNEPDGFMTRDKIVANFEQYVERLHLQVHYRVQVASVEQKAEGEGYMVRTAETVWEARHVVIATGLLQYQKIPSFGIDPSPQITQLHSGRYRNPQALPPGVCWRPAAPNQVARSQKSCTRVDAGSIHVSVAPGASPAGIEARTSTSGCT